MKIIPAIDIKGGRCVRLTQGLPDKEQVFSDEPLAMALKWQEKGAGRLHLVDLDGAFQGRPVNAKVITEIAKSLSIPVQVGGGIRSLSVLEDYFLKGVDSVVLGTSAVANQNFLQEAVKKFGSDKIIAGIDAKNGLVAIKGWVKTTNISSAELAEQVSRLGISRIVYTDISRDGMMSGPNIKELKSLAESTNLGIIASGGVSTIEDIKRIKKLAYLGVEGIIIGKALYLGSIKLEDAIKAAGEDN